MRVFHWQASATVLALVFVAPRVSAADFRDLLVRVPEQANLLTLVDVEGLHNSPIGKREGWAEKHVNQHLQGAIGIPPTATKAVLAAHVDVTTLHNTWEIGLVHLRQPLAMARLAQMEHGSLDNVAGQEVVLSARNAYFVALAPQTLGLMQPANRQELARWLRASKPGSQVALSPYLQQAAAETTAQRQVVLAVDLADMVDAEGVRRRLSDCKALAGQPVNLDQLARIFTGLKGLVFTASAGQGLDGELRVDFTEPVEPLLGVAKPLLLEVLGRIGAAIEDLASWQVRAAGSSIVLQGKLSERGLRQVLSLIAPPPIVLETKPPPTPPGKTGTPVQNPKAVASQNYFRAVQMLLDDLRQGGPSSMDSVPTWLDRYAHRIDQLPMLDVDEELLKYGTDVSSKLRLLAQSAQGVSMQQSLLDRQKSVTQIATAPSSYYGGYYGGYGGYSYDPGSNYVLSNVKQVNTMKKQISAAEGQARLQVWRSIEDAGAAVRAKMVQKYHVEF